MMKALVFGSSGQDGFYLRQLLIERGIEFVGASRSGTEINVDVGNHAQVREVMGRVKPAYVFHLAAVSSTSHDHLWANHHAIATGTLAVLEAVEKECREARVVLVGSGLQFRNNSSPIDEDGVLDHSSPYVIARNQSLFAARYYRSRGLNVYFAYLFNHDSPKRGSHHLNMKIAEFAVRASQGDKTRLGIGDLKAVKEFVFAGEVVAALWLLANQDSLLECVVGSGIGHSVEYWIDKCYSSVGLSWRDHVYNEPGFAKPYSKLVSSPEKIMSLGWRPKVEVAELVQMLVEEAKRRCGSLV